MRINERLNLTIPLYRDGDTPYAWVHSTPISNEVFEANYVLLAKTFSSLVVQGMGNFLVGPRIAALALRDVARDMAGRDNDGDMVSGPFLNEVRRITNVLMATPAGWDIVSFQEAVTRKLLDTEDLRRTENGLVFFMLNSQVPPLEERAINQDGLARMLGARTLSLNCSEFAASLMTSTATVVSGAIAQEQVDRTLPTAPPTRATATITAPNGSAVMSSVPS